MADTTLSADQVINRTLIAQRGLTSYKFPTTDSVMFRTYVKGDTVGVVYSYVTGQGDGGLWWMFYDAFGNPYYAKHEAGNFNLGALKDQGAMTEQELREKEEFDALPWYEKLVRKYGLWVVGAIVVSKAVPPLIDGLIKNRKQ